MEFQFSADDIEHISGILGVVPKHRGNNYRFEIENRKTGRSMALEIYPDIPIGKRKGSLVSVYTPNAHLQLHFCTGYVVSKMLGEITFVGEHNGKLSGLIIEREGGCSLYANVDRAILSGDFTTLGPEVMLSGIALSLTENILPSAQSGGSERGSLSGTSPKRNPRVGPKTKKRKSTRRK
ncbi:MAG TPA: hypothetical protein VNN76_08385 [Bacteroidota bacterium]|nr:hypothetical protein [Bacteroidota bacterium]